MSLMYRIRRTAAATLMQKIYVDETLTDTTAGLAVVVSRPDGTVVTTGTAAHPSTGIYTFVLPGGPSAPASATWQLDWLTVTWTGTLTGAVITMTDTVEVVGGFLFGLAEARASDASLLDPVKYTTAQLAAARIEVEQECERLTGRSFVPQFRRILLNGSGRSELATPNQDLRVIRAASLSWVTGQALTAVTGAALSSIVATSEGTLVRPAGIPWPRGLGNVLVEYEYGWDQPPAALASKAMVHLRSVLNVARSGVPDRVYSYTTSDGAMANTFRLAQPSRGSTGIPEVDAVYARYQAPVAGFA